MADRPLPAATRPCSQNGCDDDSCDADTPEISVIINSYNYARFLGQAIDSALSQKGGIRAEIIVVDDGSTDDTGAVLARYDGAITAIRQANAGQAAAINAGVRASRGKVLAFLDADDQWAPDKLAAVARAFRADPELSLVYHRLQPIGLDGSPRLRPIPRSLCSGDLEPLMRASAGWWPFPMTSAIAVRRASWDRAGEIPAVFRISADAWLVGIQPLLGRVAALSQPLGFYRIHDNHWHRAVDDPAMLRHRIAHWHETVAQMNRFAESHTAPSDGKSGGTPAFSLEDHLPCKVAEARLRGVTYPERLALGWQTLRFQGEPNPLRRLRDAWRLIRDLRPEPMVEAMAESAPQTPPQTSVVRG